MVKNDISLSETVDSIHNTMVDCKSKLKNRAVLRSLTDLAPISQNATRWSGKYNMVTRFNRIRTELTAAADHQNTTVRINTTTSCKLQAQRYEDMLKYDRKQGSFALLP